MIKKWKDDGYPHIGLWSHGNARQSKPEQLPMEAEAIDADVEK